jgi:hypothetical protein
MRMVPTVLYFWDTMGLEPFGGEKDVVSFVLFEQGSEAFVDHAKNFLRRFGEAYEVRPLFSIASLRFQTDFSVGLFIGTTCCWIRRFLCGRYYIPAGWVLQAKFYF